MATPLGSVNSTFDTDAWGGGGASAFTDLTDGNISLPADGQHLVYRTSDNQWHNESLYHDYEAAFGDGTSVIAVGTKFRVSFAFDCEIVAVRALADQTGSIVFDLWVDTYANYPPTIADTITASDKPTISSATKAENTSLTGWTTTITAGDILIVNVDSCSVITQCTLAIKVKRT